MDHLDRVILMLIQEQMCTMVDICVQAECHSDLCEIASRLRRRCGGEQRLGAVIGQGQQQTP